MRFWPPDRRPVAIVGLMAGAASSFCGDAGAPRDPGVTEGYVETADGVRLYYEKVGAVRHP